jgi:hypothetical protein
MLAALAMAGGGDAAGAQPDAKKPAPKQEPKQPARATNADTAARTAALAREISKLRGLPLRAPIQQEVVDKAELRRRLIAMSATPKEQALLAREEVLMKHWGLVPESVSYYALLLDVLSEQIAGYYDARTKRLTLTDDPAQDPAWSEMVLSHEIQHALQDQTFPLEKFRDVPAGEEDAGLARLALIEGDGIAVMLAVASARAGEAMPWPAADLASLAEALAESTEPEMANVPLAIRELLAFPYRAGFSFVAELLRQQPWRAVDAAFRRPPLSTEQILHPSRYVQNEAPLLVAKLALPAAVQELVQRPAGGAVVTPAAALPAAVETVWGELGFALWLRSHGVEAAMAAKAADGWGGDRVAVLPVAGGGAAGVGTGVARLRWDSEADAREAQEAAVRAMDRWVVGLAYEQGPDRTAWMDARARISFVERRGDAMVIGHHVPLRAIRALGDELWKTLPVTAPAMTPSPVLTPAPAPPRRRAR